MKKIGKIRCIESMPCTEVYVDENGNVTKGWIFFQSCTFIMKLNKNSWIYMAILK